LYIFSIVFMKNSTDVHQHLWPEALIAALTWRREPPLVRRRGSDWVLQLRDEPEHRFDERDHDPRARLALLEGDGIDRALLAISSPLGIEGLPREEAEPLLEAHNGGLLELAPQFGLWGAVAVNPPWPGDVDTLLDAGAVGVSLPAGAVRHPAGLDRCAGVLDRLEARDAPLLIHPGPGPGPRSMRDRQASFAAGVPAWWPAMTRYVADMNAAWHAFIAFGRPRHPRLRIVFAMLAGGAPLHFERLAARGGPTGALADEGLFYDTSSYGGRTIDALVRCVGIDQLVYGSDRPVVAAATPSGLGPAARKAIVATNVGRLLGGSPVVAA
jgi:predicted TIM-barrel fold metal-dependent hydrolase